MLGWMRKLPLTPTWMPLSEAIADADRQISPKADNVFTGHPQVAQPAASFRSSGRNQPHERMSHDRCSSV
jgi:hypothetical protein